MPMKSQTWFTSFPARRGGATMIAAPACLVFFLILTATLQTKTELPKSDPTTELRVRVEAYLATDDSKEQARLVKEIEELAKGDISLIESAIKDAKPWKADVPPEGIVGLPHLNSWPADAQPKASYYLPEDYSVDRKYPIVLALAAQPYAEWLEATKSALDLPPSVVVLFNPNLGSSLAHGAAWSELNSAMLRETARMFSIDESRIYLIADQERAAAAWNILLSGADRFAGAVIHAGHPDLPYPAQSYPLFIQNLRYTPVLVKEDLPDRTPPSDSAEVMPVGSAQLRALESLATKEGIPLKVIRSSAKEASVSPWRAEAQALLDRTRPSQVQKISHWFAGPAQGSAWWLRATKLEGTPWDAQQVSILTRADTPHDDFITGFFGEHLALLSGEMADNTITVQTHHCSKIEIYLTAGMIDWSRPVTITVNGIKRYDSVPLPSIKTMLLEASDGHSSHPVRAVIALDVHADPPRRRGKVSPPAP